jgi:hypothetical protein
MLSECQWTSGLSIIYNGCTYLPVRASSALMKEPIEWDKASKTVFIGKTISNPNKSTANISTEAAIAASELQSPHCRNQPWQGLSEAGYSCHV